MFDPTVLLVRTDAATSESWPLVVNVRRETGVTADLPLDPLAEAFLVQHRLRNKPLMPVVVGLEGLAEVAPGRWKVRGSGL